MHAGRLRHRVTVEELLVTQDSDGNQVEDWAAIAPPLPAEISPLSGRDLIAAQAAASLVTTRIVMRYRPGFKASMRVLHRDTVYSISAVVPDPESGRRWVTLLCTSGVAHVNEV